jgi:CspA family cold shock protein
MKGTVKRWITGRGYGFIETDQGNRDIFVHFSEVENGEILYEGQRVEFDLEPSDQGPRAINVRLIEE